MPRSVLAGLLVLGVSLNGCAGARQAVQTAQPSAATAGWNTPPEPEHPVRDWCRAHPVATGALTGLVLVGGAVLVAGALAAAISSEIH